MLIDTSQTDGPLLAGMLSVVPGVAYQVQVKLMMGDLDGTHEYADISVDGRPSGRCGNNANSLSAASCDWLSCSSGLADVNSANSAVAIRVNYNSAYNYAYSGPCQVNGTSSVYAAALVTLIPRGEIYSIRPIDINVSEI